MELSSYVVMAAAIVTALIISSKTELTINDSMLVTIVVIIMVWVWQAIKRSKNNSSKSTKKIIKDNENFMRLLTCLNHAGRKACIDIMLKNGLHMLNDEKKFNLELQNFKATLRKVKQNKILKGKDWDILYPSSNRSNIDQFDITLICIVIRYCTTAPAPKGGWDVVVPQQTDNTEAAFILRLRAFRNKLAHTGHIKISEIDFQNVLWPELMTILKGLGYNPMHIATLRTCSLDATHTFQIDVIRSHVDACVNELDALDRKDNDLTNKIENVNCDIKKLKQVNQSQENDLKQIQSDLIQQVQTNSQERQKLDSQLNILQREFKELTENLRSLPHGLDTPNDVALLRVLDITCEKIGEDWKALAESLGISESDIAMLCEHLSFFDKLRRLFEAPEQHCKRMLRKCFQLKGNKISWKDLKYQLQRLQRWDVIMKLKAETNLTEALNGALLKHKSSSQAAYSNQQIPKPFMTHSGTWYETKKRKDAFVDVAILKGHDVDATWARSDRDYHLHAMYVEKDFVNINDIMTLHDELVFISGIAGIGKSTLVDLVILKWASHEILNGTGNMPKVELLLPIKCCELNTIVLEENESHESILQKVFPKIFQEVDIEMLQDMGDKLLILIDGIDELLGADQMQEQRLSQLVSFILELTKKRFLESKRVMIAGRPRACRELQSIIEKEIKVKRVEVCGFSDVSVRTYIDKSCGNENALREHILSKIVESDNLSAMARIPVYLWVICGIYREDCSIETPQTTTELLIYACLVFIRNHFKETGSSLCDVSLMDLCEKEDILRYIINTAELSYRTLREKKVLFDQKDNGNIADLEKTGFLVKSRKGELGFVYQFRHMVLQEMFCAIHVLLHNNSAKKEFHSIIDIRSCFPILAGLEGVFLSQASNNSKESIIKSFVDNICSFDNVDEKKTLIHTLGEELCQEYVNSTSEEERVIKLSLVKYELTEYICCFFEYRGDLPPSVVNCFSSNSLDIVIDEHDLPHQKQHLFHFIERCMVQCQTSIKCFRIAGKLSQKLSTSLAEFMKNCYELTIYKADLDWIVFFKKLFKSLQSSRNLKILTVNQCAIDHREMEALVPCILSIENVTFIDMEIPLSLTEHMDKMSFINCAIEYG